MSERVCVCARVGALVRMWLAPTPLGCLTLCHRPWVPAGGGSSRSSLSRGDGECVHWSQETPGLLLQSSPSSLPPPRTSNSGLDSATQPQVRLPAGTCPDRLGPGQLDGVMAVGSGCLATAPPPGSEYGTQPQGLERGQLRASLQEGPGWAETSEGWPKSGPET